MEITEYALYQKLAQTVKEPPNREVLNHIAQDELRYYALLKEATGGPPRTRVELRVYYWIARVFGIIFMMKLRDFFIRRQYASLSNAVPQAARVAKQEMNHIAALRNAMDEERLLYVGALVFRAQRRRLSKLPAPSAGFTSGHSRAPTLIALAGDCRSA